MRDIEKICKHEKRVPFYEDDYFMGSIYYGEQCIRCKHIEYRPNGIMDLGYYK